MPWQEQGFDSQRASELEEVIRPSDEYVRWKIRGSWQLSHPGNGEEGELSQQLRPHHCNGEAEEGVLRAGGDVTRHGHAEDGSTITR